MYGAVPPAGLITITPSLLPLHESLVVASVAVTGTGSLILKAAEAVHKLLSVKVIE